MKLFPWYCLPFVFGLLSFIFIFSLEGRSAESLPVPIDTSADRVKFEVPIELERIGTLRQRSTSEITSSNWTIGSETLDRDNAVYKNYNGYLVPLGIKKVRIQGGWAKTEKTKGVYSWEWLDEVINDLHAKGLTIWLQTSYGNPIYEGGGSPNLAGGIPTSEEALAAWDRWVEALVLRYKDKVAEWEIWNEPDLNANHTPEITATFNIRTAEIIKRHQPNAIVAGLAFCKLSEEFLRGFLEYAKEKGKLHLFDQLSYHSYSSNPDSSYGKVVQLKRVIGEYSDTIEFRQGENGAPSERCPAYALANYDWTELTQAKWNMRRMLGDLGHDCQSALFLLMEYFQNRSGKLIRNPKGMLRASDEVTKEVVGIKQAYYAIQNLTSVFDDSLERIKELSYTIENVSSKNTKVYGYRNKETGRQLLVFWDGSGTPSDANAVKPARFVVENGNFEDPVVVDLLTGRVYAIPPHRWRKEGTSVIFAHIPVYDSPVLIADRSLLHLMP